MVPFFDIGATQLSESLLAVNIAETIPSAKPEPVNPKAVSVALATPDPAIAGALRPIKDNTVVRASDVFLAKTC